MYLNFRGFHIACMISTVTAWPPKV
uniref:Uncharacterized protein n=1 Tax=Arundo donax TaxID=35708 RepID=A0A0A9D6E2_ARUDO